MTIWILAVLLFAGVGALGRQIGGIRMGISLLGVVVALLASGPLAPVVRSALGAVGIKNPILMWALAAPLAFLGIMMAFNSVAVAVYLKVSGYFKFRAPDDVRMRWERIDAGLGLSAGLLAAVFYLMAASSYLFHVGYFTTQVESPTDNPIWLKLVNKVSGDLSGSGFDRVAVGVGQASPAFFQTADVVGLVGLHAVEQRRGLLGWQFGDEICGVVRIHLLEDVGRALGFEHRHDRDTIILGQFLENVGEPFVVDWDTVVHDISRDSR